MTDFTIILRSLKARRFSTVVTAFTVAVAVALMLVLLSMRDAGRQAFERGSGNMHLLVSRDQSPLASILNGIFYAAAPRSPISYAEFEKISESAPFHFAIPIQLGDSYRAEWPAVATTTDFFTLFTPAPDTKWTFAQGRPFGTEFEVVLGAAMAKGTGHKIGDKLVLTHGTAQSRSGGGGEGQPAMVPHVHDEFKYTVVGILAPSGTIHDRALFTDLNSTWLIHAAEARERELHANDPPPKPGEEHKHDHDHGPPLTIADLTPGDRQITTIYLAVATRPGASVSAAIGPVASALVRDPSFNPPLTVASPTTEIRKLFIIVSNIDQIFLAMAIIVMISSGIGIMLSLYNSMAERRRQIAVLRVLGCSQGRIFSLVVTESAVIGAIGAAAGLALAVVGGFLVAGVMRDRLGLVIQPSFAPDLTLFVVLGTVFLAALAGVIPAILAYRTPVANNLKPIG